MTPASQLTIGIVLPDDTLGVLYYPGVTGEGAEERWSKAPFRSPGTASDEEFARTTTQRFRDNRRA